MKLRGLDPKATYYVEFWSKKPEEDLSGSLLMEKGITCHLAKTRMAEIIVLTKG